MLIRNNHNVGYCKFRDQCRYQHYSKVCPRSVCKEKECKFRHPKRCKFGSECHFLRRKCCVFSHKFSESNEKVFHTEAESVLMNEVIQLKAEVPELKESVELKEQQLNEMNVKEAYNSKLIKELCDENERLKQSAKMDKIALSDLKSENEGLKEANVKLNELNANKQIQYIETLMKNEEMTSLLKKKNLQNTIVSIFRCKKCDKDFQSKTEMEEHITSLHCNICGDNFVTILQLKEHEDLHCGTCGHIFINIQKLKRHKQMFGHSS